MDGAHDPRLDAPTRLALLDRLGLVGAAPREGFDRLTRLAARLTGSPVAQAVLVDHLEQHFLSQVGVAEPWATLRRTPLTHSFCQHVVTTREPLVVTDARTDDRVATNLAIRDMGVVAYLGVPLMCESECVGSLCVIDAQPRAWDDDTLAILHDLAGAAMSELTLQILLDEQRELVTALTHSERRHRMLVANLPDAIVALYDPQLRCVLAEGPMLAAQGYTPADLIGRHMQDVVPPETVDLLRPVFAAALRGERRTIEYRSPRSGLIYDMATIPFRGDGAEGDEGEVEGVFLVMRDVTERRTRELAVRRAEADLRTYFEAATIGQAVVDGEGAILEANPALGAFFGLDRARLLGVELARLVHPADVVLAQESLAGLRDGTVPEVQLQLRCMHAGGRPVHASAYAIALAPSDDGAARFLVQIVDVTDRKRFEDQLQHLADHDPLTGLANRRRFDQELARHVELVRRYGADGAVVLLDVDRFKHINDTFGHHAGDRVITAVAHLLRDRLRTTDVLARLGGDEFAILLPKADRAGAEAVARSLVEAVRARLANVGGTGHGVTISLGAAVVERTDGLSAEQLLIDADRAMYAAKAAGRDGYAIGADGPQGWLEAA